jgi:aldehyde dehydrogenase (NAD+)/betaine-aldehyde dehydrogenase
VIPWNYPLSTAARGIAPALAAGCTVVAKPAEQTPLTALLLAQIIHAAGLPAGVVNVVTGTGSQAGASLVAHAGVDHVTFTGSVATGMNVMRNAAEHSTRLLLELGGKSPLLVLADADLDRALEGVMDGIFENAGQICSAASRLLIDRRIHAAFVERLLAKTRALTLGHGLRNPGMGPLNSAAHLEKVAGFLERARSRDAHILCGGHATTDPQTGLGWFFEPTIVDDLRADDELVQEEIFGPVLAVQIFDDLEHAVDLANGTRFGLVAGIYTRDFSHAHRLAQRIDAGQVYINEYFAGGIALPFGGNKRSGFGREKGMEALRSYSKLKSVAARL